MAHTIPGKLRRARTSVGVPAWRAAKAVGIKRARLTHWETGLRAPDPAIVARLMAYYRKLRSSVDVP